MHAHTVYVYACRMAHLLTFAGSFGRAEVSFRNELWHVAYNGNDDSYAHLDQACSVAISLVQRGVPPAQAAVTQRIAELDSLLIRANGGAQ